MRVETIVVTTSAGGVATGYSSRAVTGKIKNISYVPGDLLTGSDITVIGETSLIPIITITDLGVAAVSFAPRMATCDVAGAASLYASGGEPVETEILIVNERIKLSVAQGGDTKSGTFVVVLETL